MLPFIFRDCILPVYLANANFDGFRFKILFLTWPPFSRKQIRDASRTKET